MDKYEYNIKAEQIVKLIKKKDYVTAAKIADGIDWRRVRNVNMLTNVGSVYEEVCRYQDAKEILLLAFDRAPVGRRLAYKLTEVCIESEDFGEAEEFFKEFIEIAPKDTGKYELLYKMAKKKGEPLEHLIQILEEYKAHDFEEAWAYELACLYHQARWAEKCVSECDEIILWFGEGEYVEKAMELKMLYVPLSPSQQEKYAKRYGSQIEYSPSVREEPQYERQMEAEPVALEAEQEQEPDIPKEPVSVSVDMYSTSNLQEALAESMESLLAEEADSAQKQAQESVAEQEEILGATRDIRKEHIFPKWNRMQAGLDDEDAMDLNDQIEGQITIEEVLAIYSEKEEAAAARVTGEIVLPKEIPEETSDEPEQELPAEGMYSAGMETANLKQAIDQVVEEVMESIQQDVNIESKQTGSLGLSEEYSRLFANFLHMEGLEEQLAEVFTEAGRQKQQREDSLFGNIIVVGEHKTGKTTLAVDLMKALNRLQGRKGRKIAKISGDRLNRKGIADTIARLVGSDLLIECAGEMDRTTIKDLLKAMTGATGGMRIILEDTPENMQNLLAENPDVEVRFAHRITLEECNIAQWVEAARRYAAELDYVIDDMATLALSAKLDAVLAEKSRVETEDMEIIVDAAIAKAEKKNIKKLLDIVFSRKYKDSDLTVLREIDFE